MNLIRYRAFFVACALLIVFAPMVRAGSLPGSLWYNGDFNTSNRQALANGQNIGSLSDAKVFDNFIVPVGVTWTIASVYSNNLMSADFNLTGAVWEIRQGITPGNGGTLIASGSTALPIRTATGNTGFGLPEYTIQVTGLNVALGSGTYWLSVSPMDSGVGQSFESGTIGANSVGTPAGNDGNAFFNTSGSLQTVPPGNYTPTNLIAGSPTDFSEGLTGVETPVTAETPEPASMTLLAIGACGMAGYAWRRRRQNAAA